MLFCYAANEAEEVYKERSQHPAGSRTRYRLHELSEFTHP
jgi:hypothetical protein